MKLKLIIVSIIFFNALVGSAKYHEIEFFDEASTGKGWNFEIQNKWPGQIQIDIKSYDGSLQTSKILGTLPSARKLRIAQVNKRDGFDIAIREADKNNPKSIKKSIDASDTRLTIYLTVAKDKQGNFDVYPQRGTFLGLSGKTDSGLLLDKKRNIQKDDIRTYVNPSIR